VVNARLRPSRPVVGVGVVIWRGDSFLLVRRGKAPNLGQWSIPGGAQELGETVFEAAAREVFEETRLVVEGFTIVDVVDAIMREDDGEVEYHYTLVDVVAESTAGDAVAGDDATEADWFTIDDLPGLNLWSETERIILESRLKR
jgi:ADP-ribose pyrophosphatase YjhB (NUDIX family)